MPESNPTAEMTPGGETCAPEVAPSAPASPDSPEQSKAPGVTTRAVFTGLFLVLLFAYAAPTWMLRYKAFAGWGGYLPYEAVIALVLLVIASRCRAHFAFLGGLAVLAAVMPPVIAFASWKEFSNAPFWPDFFESLSEAGQIAVLPWVAFAAVIVGAVILGLIGRVLFPTPGGPDGPGEDPHPDADGAALPGGVLSVVLFAAALLLVTREMYGVSGILRTIFAIALVIAGAAGSLRSARLGRRELIAVFIILTFGGLAIRTTGWLVGNLPKPYNLANNQNRFRSKFLKAVRPQLVPYQLPSAADEKKLTEEERKALHDFQDKERDALGRFYNGFPRVHRRPHMDSEERKTYDEKVRDREAKIRAVIRGRWVGPLARWMLLIVLVYFVQFCLAGILRRQWLENEKLMFPHTQVPLSLTEEAGGRSARKGLFSQPTFWVGAGLTGFLFLLNGLNLYFPAVPKIELSNIQLREFLSSSIFSGMGKRLNVQPFVVGISYLLSAEISFSIWFFAFLNNLFHMVPSVFNISNSHERFALCGEWLNSGEMILGATLVFVAGLAWASRRHLAQVARGAWARGLGLGVLVGTLAATLGLLLRWGGRIGWGTALLGSGGLVLAVSFVLGLLVTRGEDPDEPIPYFFSFWGFILGALGVLLWCRWANMSIWASAAIFFFYLVLILIIARAVCECGMVVAGGNFMPWRPYLAFTSVFGYKVELTWLGRMLGCKAGALLPTMAVGSFIWPSIMRNMQALPFAMTGLHLAAHTGRRRRRWLLAAVGASIVLFMVVFAHGMLSVCYDQGIQGLGQDWYTDMSPFKNHFLRDMLDKERTFTPDAWNLKCMAGGGVVMAFLIVMRRLFYWWPLHPIGFVIPGVEWGIWFSILIGWFVKRTALKYGGGSFAQRLVPFFLGLVVGQFAMQAFWAVIGFLGGNLQATVLHVQRVAG